MFTFEDKELVADPIWSYSSEICSHRIPLIIDNGSFTCKAGWACDEKPRLIFRNLIARSRVKKDGDFNGSLIGNDIASLESMKWNLKTQFDRDVVTHFEAQEQIFDYTFSHLGINTEGCVDHPIVLTEALSNPNPFRQGMSELLFECYRTPQVVYGVDSLFSFRHNMKNAKNAIIVSSGYAASHVIPICNDKIDVQHCKRINLGGMNANIFMQKLLQLKHPSLALAVGTNRAQHVSIVFYFIGWDEGRREVPKTLRELIRKYTYIAPHYDEELAKWRNEKFFKENTRIIQLPYIKPEPIVPKDPEKEREKRIKQGRRLQELNARKREEKLVQDEERLNKLLQIVPLEKINTSYFTDQLKDAGLESAENLFAEVNELRTTIHARKEKITNQGSEDGQVVAKKAKEDERNPTEGMTEEEIEGMVEDLRRERIEILEKRKLREQRKQELSNRKSHAAKERMRILTKLADGGKSSKRQKSEDTFGMNDEDWEVYKYISKEGSDSEYEQEQERLDEIEGLLSQHDLEFNRSKKASDEPIHDLSVYYQLRIEVERIRVPEIIYQPCILGLEQAGLAETLDFVLAKYSQDMQEKLVQNIFVTGGNTKFPGFKQRLENELQAMRPFHSKFNIYLAGDAELDAWHGAREWVKTVPDLSQVSVTRTDYEESGEGYLKEHKCSNSYFPTPHTG